MDFRDIKEFFSDAFKYIIVIVVVLIIVLYVVSLQQVVGPSMQPNLNNGDVLILSKIHYRLFDIKRNDVIVLNDEKNKFMIKRVIGLPGETISYKDNILYIDGVAYNEKLYEGITTADFDLKDLEYDKIPEDTYFVLGDNRGNSTDSRILGPISKEDIIGKVMVKIWPLNEFKLVK